jgi:hypothetical protein
MCCNRISVGFSEALSSVVVKFFSTVKDTPLQKLDDLPLPQIEKSALGFDKVIAVPVRTFDFLRESELKCFYLLFADLCHQFGEAAGPP